MLALSSGIQKWFWLDHRVKTALSGKSNLSLTVVQSIVSFLWSQWWVAAAAVWHILITFTYTMTIYIYIYTMLSLLASKRWKKCLFSAVWRIWRATHINNPSNISAHIQRRIKKEQNNNQRKQDCYPQTNLSVKSNLNSVPLFVLNCSNSQPHLKARSADCNATYGVWGGLFNNVRFHLPHGQHWQAVRTAALNSQMEGAARTAACWLVVQIATSGWAHIVW